MEYERNTEVGTVLEKKKEVHITPLLYSSVDKEEEEWVTT